MCKDRDVDTDLELEIHKLFDRKAESGVLRVGEASEIIDRLKSCPKKTEAA